MTHDQEVIYGKIYQRTSGSSVLKYLGEENDWEEPQTGLAVVDDEVMEMPEGPWNEEEDPEDPFGVVDGNNVIG